MRWGTCAALAALIIGVAGCASETEKASEVMAELQAGEDGDAPQNEAGQSKAEGDIANAATKDVTLDDTASGEDETASAVDATTKKRARTTCPIISSRDWRAWVDDSPRVLLEPRRDGPQREMAGPRLHVRGFATLPTPGYEPVWRKGPPGDQLTGMLNLELSFEPPEGIVSQVVVEAGLEYSMPVQIKSLRGVTITCGDQTLAEIKQMIIAQ